jgi:Acyl-CoA oxidase
LYTAIELSRYAGILEITGVSCDSIDLIKTEMTQALSSIGKHALGLIEAFELSDQIFNSTIRRWINI